MINPLTRLILAARSTRLQATTAMVPADWMPNAPMARIILHWTAGAYVASALDREHYHLLVQNIDGKAQLVRGQFPITANISPLKEGEYAAHTRATNSNSVGLAICAMHDATQRPLNAGKFPITQGQWDLAVKAIAELCTRYKIPVTEKTVLTHAEVEKNLGIWQRGKWDIAVLPFVPGVSTAEEVGRRLRAEVARYVRN